MIQRRVSTGEARRVGSLPSGMASSHALPTYLNPDLGSLHTVSPSPVLPKFAHFFPDFLAAGV